MHTARYPDVPDDFGHWLAGLIDGEGCFLIIHDRRHGRFGHFQTHFRIGLRSDDAALLETCRHTTGLGSLMRIKTDPHNDQRRSQVRWQVYTRDEAFRLVELLEQFPLRSKKARDFVIWAAAVRLHKTVDGYGRYGRHGHIWQRLGEMKRELIEIRQWCDHESVVLEVGVDDSIPARGNMALF